MIVLSTVWLGIRTKYQIFAFLTGYDTGFAQCRDLMKLWWVKMNTYKLVDFS